MAVTTKIADLTGPGLTDAYGMGGTDLGIVTTAPDGRLVAVFGDTFERAGVGGPGWRSPVVLFADPGDIGSGLRWTGSGGDTRDYACRLVAKPTTNWFRLHRRVTTMLPADVITVGDTMYLHMMANKGLGNVLYSEVIASTDSGVTWERTGCRWRGDHHDGLFQQLTWCAEDDGYVYAYTTGFQRTDGLLLHRVPADRITDRDAWEPWGFSGERWDWGNPPTRTIPGAFGELNLRKVPGPDGREHRLLVFFDAGNYRIDAMLLDAPNADLHRAPRVTLLQGCGWDDEDHATGRVAQLYGGYVVPGSTLDDLHLVVSQWNTTTNWPYKAMQFRTDATELLRR